MTGQTWMIESVAKATAEQELPDQQLWFGVLAPYRRHAAVPLFFGKFVHRRRGEKVTLSLGYPTLLCLQATISHYIVLPLTAIGTLRVR